MQRYLKLLLQLLQAGLHQLALLKHKLKQVFVLILLNLQLFKLA